MSFLSPGFFLFLPAVLLTYRLLPRNGRCYLLLAASYFFYACHNVWLLGLIFLTTGTSYLCALGMEKARTPAGRKGMLALNAGICLGVLFLFKYLGFALDLGAGLARLLGFSLSSPGLSLLLPMGISFYVFQTMSYAIDVYRGTVPAERHLGYYALFVVFFPQLVAGPIERPGDLLPQLKAAPSPTREDHLEGGKYLLRGYAKKVIAADFLAGFVDTAYAAPSAAGGAALTLATALFAAQIYCDFSGYSDIALGCARLMGIRLSENFRQPYLARSPGDFWRRWHISLTRWFTDYVYIPLGGSRRGTLRRYRNILLVFLASGLWHGADGAFLIWGGLHGVFLILDHMLFSRRESLSAGIRCLRRTLTLAAVWFAWIFFRAGSLPLAGEVLREIFTDFRPAELLSGLSMRLTQVPLLVLTVALVPLLDRLPSLSGPPGSRRVRCAALGYFLLITAVVFARFLVLSQGGDRAFIYFQF